MIDPVIDTKLQEVHEFLVLILSNGSVLWANVVESPCDGYKLMNGTRYSHSILREIWCLFEIQTPAT